MDWTHYKTFDNSAAAELLVTRLLSNGVPARIDYGALESGVDGISVYVASNLVHRARWLEVDCDISEAELSYLATGQWSGGSDDGAA